MTVLTPEDYERLAKEICEQYLTGGTALNDGVYKVANELGLSPDAVRSLSWATNTATHLELFEKAAGEDGKYVQFPVASPDYVLKKIYSAEEMPLASANDADKIAFDFFSPLEQVTEKVAYEDNLPELKDHEDYGDPLRATRKAEKLARARIKTASELEQEMLAARELYIEQLYKLAFDLRKLSANRDEFEKDAFALYGDDSVPMINDLRSVYNFETTGSEKLACEFERVVDTKTAAFKSFTKLKQHFDDTVKFAKSLAFLKNQKD